MDAFEPNQPEQPIQKQKPAPAQEGQVIKSAPSPEKSQETAPKAQPKEPAQKQVVAQPAKQSTKQPVAPEVRPEKSETLRKIEHILQEDMGEIYAEMPPDKKVEFKQEGEAAAKEIEGMLFKVSVHSKKILKLLLHWLKIIPGVNKFFLSQEAKLKADEIMKVKEELDKSRSI